MNNLNLIDDFKINSKQFFIDMEKEKIKMTDFNRTLQFKIQLPFHIPIPSGLYCTTLDNNNIMSFVFFEKEVYKKTISEVELFYSCNTNKVSKNFISNIFDKLFLYFNQFLTCYIYNSQDYSVHNINQNQIYPICLYQILQPKKKNKIKKGCFLVNYNLSIEKSTVSPELMQNITKTYYLILNDKNPFFKILPTYQLAMRYLHSNDYKNAIIFIQSYIELFLRIVLYQILFEESEKEKNINSIIEETPFITIIKKYMPLKLGGCWNINSKSSKISNWYKHTYILRNNIIHAGHNVTITEANDAINSAIDFLSFICVQIKKKKKTYPILNTYLI